MNTDRKLTIWIKLVLIAATGIALVEIARGPRSFFFGFDRDLHARFENVATGDGLNGVLERLGDPIKKGHSINLPQRHGYEELFKAAANSTAVEFYLWRNGMNWFYCIGFDSFGAVAFKGEGHS